MEDTAKINAACELGGDAGAFMAGASSNKIAAGYMDSMMNTALTMNTQEKLNLEMFRQKARESGLADSDFRGAGVFREYIPSFMREDICNRPEPNSRPKG